jgi:hypothetical protein
MLQARRTGLVALLVGLVLLAAGRPLLAQAQANPFVGVWELDRFKSEYDPIATAPQKQIVTIAATANAGEFSFRTRTWRAEVASDTTYNAKFDGADYPTSAAQTLVSFKRVNASTIERTAKLFGEVAETATWTVSADGKQLTIKRKGTDTTGMPFSSTALYIKTAAS